MNNEYYYPQEHWVYKYRRKLEEEEEL